jgi:signal transduction histidine kinase
MRPQSHLVLLSLIPNEHTLDLIVSDDGMGMPLESQANVFDTAYRAPDARLRGAAGSGLGLAIVRRVVEQHRGSVHLESRYGEGTTVVITLPLDAVDSPPIPP